MGIFYIYTLFTLLPDLKQFKMGQITFTTEFSGGTGTLTVSFDDISDVLNFNENSTGPQSVQLDSGAHIYTVSGAAPNGPGGNIQLSISGDVSSINQSFNGGLIPPNDYTLVAN